MAAPPLANPTRFGQHGSAERGVSMDEMSGAQAPVAGERAIQFTGTWREYLPIAATNLLLSIVTLGIYRFWATARQRRYLWSRTEIIGDPLEWTGTGKEMLIGFLIVMLVLAPFFIFIQFLFPALLARRKLEAATGLLTLFYLAIIYLGGVARFRGLRYRLSRSWWRGIRGGSDEPGWQYGGEYLGRTLVAAITMWIVYPWAAVFLWNKRWSAMSFGQLNFSATLTTDGLKRRWAALYLVPVAMIVMILVSAALGAAFGKIDPSPAGGFGILHVIVLLIVVTYLLFPLALMHFYAKFYRRAADTLRLGDLEFGFDATTWQWIKLFLGNFGLAIVTLGFGVMFWGYRTWSFLVRHTQIYGEIDAAGLNQSTTHAPTEAEGFADAFDVGAF